MIPKLALNFSIDKDTTTEYLLDLFNKMRASKVIYVEVVIRNVTTLNEMEKFIGLFKKMRNSKHIDYTIWIEVGSDPMKAHELFLAANKLDKLVMGIASLTEITDLPNLLITMNNMSYPDIQEIMMFSDDRAMENSLKAINDIHAPEGMKRGLQRVIDDYAKIYSRLKQEPHLEEIQISSDQD